MKIKSVVTVVLLAFVALSVVRLLINPREAESVSAKGDFIDPDIRMVSVYYFHGNVRCPTCRKIEAYTAESITSVFTNELSNGRLEWKIVNTDEPENEHFVSDYKLTTRSVVLVDRIGGKQVNWKNLSDIWDLVDDQPAFKKYIVDETNAFLNKEAM